MELGYGILYLVKICCIIKAMFPVYWIQCSSCTAIKIIQDRASVPT